MSPLWWEQGFPSLWKPQTTGHALGQMPQSNSLFKHRSQKEICIPLHRLSPGFWCFQAKQSPFLVEIFFGEGLQVTPALCRGSVTPALQQIRFAVSMGKISSVPSPDTQHPWDPNPKQDASLLSLGTFGWQNKHECILISSPVSCLCQTWDWSCRSKCTTSARCYVALILTFN